MNTTCIYHADCMDGSCSAWCVDRWNRAGHLDVAYHAANYGDAPPNVRGRHVIIADFSYPRDVLEQMVRDGALSILVLDHHRTAEKMLGDLPRMGTALGEGYAPLAWMRSDVPIRVVFDVHRSGAQLTWDALFPNEPRPMVVDYVADRDLWHHALLDSREINAWIASNGALRRRDEFSRLEHILRDDANTRHIASMGRAVLRMHDINVREALVRTMRWWQIGGHEVPVANLPRSMTSDGAGLLAEWNPKAPFAAAYEDLPSVRKISLRSRGEFNVSSVAEQFGGGGHRGAASFVVQSNWCGD